MHIRHTHTRQCKLSCKNCYLKEPSFLENAVPVSSEFPSLEENINIYQYFNVVDTKNIPEEYLNQFINLFKKYFSQDNIKSYTLITDISTFFELEKYPETHVFHIKDKIQKTASLSFKKNSDYEKISQIEIDKNITYVFSFIYGLDKPENFEKICKAVLEVPNFFLSFQLEKPIEIDDTLHLAILKLKSKLLHKIQIDPCIEKAFAGYDCTVEQQKEKIWHEKIVSFVEDEGYYNCTYPSSKCIINYTKNPNNLGYKIIKELNL